jgi:4,5-dihydroxyphthalate decarboxylase
MADLSLTFACLKYNHVRALMDGAVRPEGINLTCLDIDPEQIHPRMLRDQEFDVSEMGLTFYLGTLARDDPPFIAIPVFTSRGFRHGTIYVNSRSGIEKPTDLVGRKVGEQRAYGHDAGMWSKGILSDDYGVKADQLTYYIGGVNNPVPNAHWLPHMPPPHVEVHHLGPGQTLSPMLESGEIDALFAATEPHSLETGKVRRLFADHVALERDYFRRTRIHPIMHTVVIKREIVRKNPWVPRALYEAFREAKRRHDEYYRSIAAKMHRVLTLCWATELYAENRKLMGDDAWPYGVAANHATLATALRYHHEQGMSKRRFAPEEIFASETLSD